MPQEVPPPIEKKETPQKAPETQKDKLASLKDELEGAVPQFPEEDKKAFKEAIGKDIDAAVLTALSMSDALKVEERSQGFLSRLTVEKGKIKEKEGQEKEAFTFNARRNEKLEWGMGLRDIVDEHVRKITLRIHPRNLDKGGNKALLKNPEAKRIYAQYKRTDKVEYFTLTSDERRGAKGDFFANKEYMRIFSGDQWTEDERMTDEQLAAYKQTDAGKLIEPRRGKDTENSSDIDNFAQIGMGESAEVQEKIAIRLSPRQRDMAALIEKEFLAAGLSKNLAAAAIVNAYAESGLNPDAVGDGGHSVGLFQENDWGAGRGMTVEARKDPVTNIRTILKREVLAGMGRRLRAADKNGASVEELTNLFCQDIERPKDKVAKGTRRAWLARRFFKLEV